jgi:hypothetical protein
MRGVAKGGGSRIRFFRSPTSGRAGAVPAGLQRAVPASTALGQAKENFRRHSPDAAAIRNRPTEAAADGAVQGPKAEILLYILLYFT